jgi:hypothetical protein
MQTYTAIDYKQAADLLGVSIGNIRTAASRGMFTKLPVTNQKQHLIKEQVELFQGKKQIRKGALSREEAALWHKYDQLAAQSQQQEVSQQTSATPSPATPDLSDALRGLDFLVKIGRLVKPQDEKSTPPQEAIPQAFFQLAPMVLQR